MRELDTKWTAAQRDAIRSRGETLLVSAAAGSGKTAVLTERIIDRLLDADDALELSSVLVVTFTKAAAAELKTRIRAALDREIAKNPDNRHLQTQLLSVSRAKICTIDSFCLDLIRAHFDTLGLSPRVSVSDETAAGQLCKSVMNTLIDDYFDGNITEEAEQIADFGAFSDLFVTSRSAESLAEVLLSVRETVNGYEEGVGWLTKQRDRLCDAAEHGFLASDAGAVLFGLLTDFAARWTSRYRDLCAFLCEDEVYRKNYGDCFAYEMAWCETLSALLSKKNGDMWDAICAHFAAFDAPKLKTGIRGDKKTDEILRAKARHDAFNDARKDIGGRYFCVSAAECAALTRMQAEVVGKLATLLSVYESRLAAEKKRRQTLDFGDMGRLALTLLWDRERNAPSAIARAEADKYTEIYIDEYQDVSPVQDKIFSAIAKPDNRFMVGDAKQSIYGFRGASPKLFLDYRTRFAEQPGCGRTVFLSENFRCDEQVIAFSNLIFSVLFGVGEMPYTDDDALKYAKPTEGETPQTKVSFAILKTDRDEDGEGDEMPQEETDADETPSTLYTEAAYVADTVATLLKNGTKRDGSPIRPRDIAVLVRSAKSSATPIAEALEAHGIPSYNSVSRAFFENAEVLLMYSLLAVIDNPGRDVFLAGALKSPLYRVTLDELIYMRRTYPHGSLYDALCVFCAETGFAKGQYFLEKLAHYRRRVEGMPVDRFLWYLYQDTGILSLVYEKEHDPLFSKTETGSAQMRANLMMLYEYARAFERSSFQGLYRFVSFIGNVIEEKQQMPPVLLSGEDADAVRIMTVHQSKGLEFPVCFLYGCGKRFNDSDTRSAVMLDADAGIATYLRDETGFARINHPARETVRRAILSGTREEEKRVLYVALTRAREQLYITASAKDPSAKAEALRLLRGEDVDAESLCDASDNLTWMMTALCVRGDAAEDVCRVCYPDGSAAEAVADVGAATAARTTADTQPSTEEIPYRALCAKLDAVLSYVYPDEVGTQIPSKLSVSELHRMHTENADTDETDATESAVEDEAAPTRNYAIPRFLEGGADDHPTPAQRGTATHEFMQFCDYRALADETLPRAERIAAEILRLTENGFISAETAARIDRKTLAVFLKSSLFACLTRAETVRREVRFNLYVPATRVLSVAGAERQVLVQGIVDCYYTDEAGRVILIDYKTDHFSKTQCKDPASVERILKERHGEQMSYYLEAVEQLLCRPVYDVRIYSFALGYDFSVL